MRVICPKCNEIFFIEPVAIEGLKKAKVLKCTFCNKEFELPRLRSIKYISCPYCGTYRRIYE